MMVLLVRNKVKEYDHWRRVFDAQADVARAAGVTLNHMWQSADDPNDVFFLLDIEDRGRAEAYMSTPESAAVGVEAGVLDGDYHFLTLA